MSSIQSENNDIQFEKEAEYDRLQRQFRIMENDRKAYAQESERIISKQNMEIDKLNGNVKELRKDLELIDSESNKKKDNQISIKLKDFAKQKNEIVSLIKQERETHEMYKNKIAKIEKKIKDENKNVGGVNAGQDHSRKTSTNIKRLETQLELTNNKYSKCLAANRMHRKEIRSLDIEQKRFDNTNKKLTKKHDNIKQNINELIEQSTSAYDARDEAQNKMIALKEKNDKDVMQHNAEMKELIRIIDHDRRLREFMNTKCKERKEDEELIAWRENKEKQASEKKLEYQVDTVDTYEKAFNRIKEITGEDDIDLLVSRFIEMENRNFALFNYVNEQNNRIEELNEQINKIKSDMNEFESERLSLEINRVEMLNNLDENIKTKAEIIEITKTKQENVSKIIGQLVTGIESLFDKIGCNKNLIEDLNETDKQSHKVDEHNILQHMGVIEEQINKLLLIKGYLAGQKEEDFVRKNVCLLGDGPIKIQNAPTVVPPAIGDEIESEPEEDNRPLMREDLINKAMRNVHIRENEMNREFSRFDYGDIKKK
ncbi:Coiled-coil domain-containing protein 63 [Intoshia linei]|uniref:Coiled-coil domain-containing protein 63 n=1 Tax=Intoshia linei TaxID=1819745 RepID=A0A177AV41_9BILA|nr:Coiled-coil domain-containing protein 63 [Intoshia linei]